MRVLFVQTEQSKTGEAAPRTLRELNRGDVFYWGPESQRDRSELCMKVNGAGQNTITASPKFADHKFFWMYLEGPLAGSIFCDAGEEHITERKL